jgi:uncharacterized membrane protein
MSKNHISEEFDDVRGTNRLEAFSDGVISITITLLVLNIHVPNENDTAPLLTLLLKQWPSYLNYVTSFIVIGIFWVNHHNMFKYIKRADHFFLLVNILFLMCLVFIPFVTALLAAYVNKPEQHTAALLYSGTLLLTAIMFNVIWWYAARKRFLLDPRLNPHIVNRLTRSYLIGIPLYVLSMMFSLVSVEASLLLYIFIALIYALPSEFLHPVRWWSTLRRKPLPPPPEKEFAKKDEDHYLL